MKSLRFFAELKRRNVYKVAVAYAIVGWLSIQIATQVFPFLEIPNWVVRLVIVAVAIGFPIALVIAWAFELTPEGFKRTEDVDASGEHVPKKHAWIYVVVNRCGDFGRIVFHRPLLGTNASTRCQSGSDRGGYNFDNPAKIDRGAAI